MSRISTPQVIPNNPVPIFTLAALAAMAPLAIDAYLPAMPAMAKGLQVSIHDIELSLSIFLAAFSIGQVIGGPFSDHFGRRRAIFTGIALFAIGSAGIMASKNVHTLWLFRVIEALGAGLMAVNAPAVIRDLSNGQQSARNLSHMAVIMMLAPLVAPMLGMGILQIGPWQAIFLFLLAFSLLVAVTVHFRLPETRIQNQQRPGIWQRYHQILCHRHALGFVAAQSFAYGGMFAFITASPLVYISFFGVSQQLYPFLVGANVLMMVIANRINVRLLKNISSKHLLGFGQGLQSLAGISLLTYILLATTPKLAITAVLVISFVGTQGFIVSNATANMIEFFPNNSGTASALLGACSFMTGACSSGLVGIFGDGTPQPMAVMMCVCTLSGVLLRVALQFRRS